MTSLEVRPSDDDTVPLKVPADDRKHRNVSILRGWRVAPDVQNLYARVMQLQEDGKLVKHGKNCTGVMATVVGDKDEADDDDLPVDHEV